MISSNLLEYATSSEAIDKWHFPKNSTLKEFNLALALSDEEYQAFWSSNIRAKNGSNGNTIARMFLCFIHHACQE